MLRIPGLRLSGQFPHALKRGVIPVIAVRRPPKNKKTVKRLFDGACTEDGRPVCGGGKPMARLGMALDGAHHFRCPAGGCKLKEKPGWSRYCDPEHSEKPEGKLLRVIGLVPRFSKLWRKICNKRGSLAVVQQRQALPASGQAPTPDDGQDKCARQHVHAGVAADRLGAPQGRRLPPHEAHVHPAAAGRETGRRNPRRAGTGRSPTAAKAAVHARNTPLWLCRWRTKGCRSEHLTASRRTPCQLMYPSRNQESSPQPAVPTTQPENSALRSRADRRPCAVICQSLHDATRTPGTAAIPLRRATGNPFASEQASGTPALSLTGRIPAMASVISAKA